MKQLNKGNTIHIKTLKLSHKTLTETKKTSSHKKKLFSSLHPPPRPPETNPSSIRQATNYKLPAARHSSQPLKAYKPKINSKISSEIWLPTCFSPHKSPQDNSNRLSYQAASEQCHQCKENKHQNSSTQNSLSLSLSLSLSSETPKNKNLTKKNLVKQTWKFAQFFHRKKASRIFDTHPKK